MSVEQLKKTMSGQTVCSRDQPILDQLPVARIAQAFVAATAAVGRVEAVTPTICLPNTGH